MKQFAYGERDYIFGQRLLTLRTQLGLTQAQLAQRLQVSARTVGQWEQGSSSPKAERLKELITLAVQQHAFAAGREEEEIRAFWKAAHPKVLLDESWLSSLLGQAPAAPSAQLVVPAQQPLGVPVAVSGAAAPRLSAPASGPLLDWGEALSVPNFYGREGELATLEEWIVQDRCRVVSVLGLGGIGKSTLVVQIMQRLAGDFEVVLFRALRDAPSCQTLLESCLQVLAPEALVRQPQDLPARLSLLLSELRRRRVLLVLDNLESLLQEGEVRGRLRPGYEDYRRLLQEVAQSGHQSCLLLTSREQLTVLGGLEGSQRSARALRLSGLSVVASEQLLAEHELLGSPEEHARLVQVYEGNPLALNIVAQTIAELFGGDIRPFLSAEIAIFGGIAQLLSEHWGRLSALEQTVLFWLAILREPVTLEELRTVLVAPLAPGQLLEAVEGLRRRSLIERGQRAGSFTLQSVVLEDVTERLVKQAREEIEQGRLSRLREHGLSQARAKEYVRQTQERLLLSPLLSRLQNVYRGRAQVEERLRELLAEVRNWAEDRQGYGPANLVTLLRLLCGHLRGLDLSRLLLRSVHLQGVDLQDATLSGALLRECVFTQTFDAIWAVAISGSGHYWAAASRRGEVWVWRVEREAGEHLHLDWRAHTNIVRALAFSPDERTLASGSFDGSLKLWDVERGALLWAGGHPGADCLAFSPEGDLLASGGHEGSVRLWDAKLGTTLEALPHPGPVFALAWSPDGHLLASGDVAGTIRLWQRQPSGTACCVQTFSEHSSWVYGLAFAPDGRSLASASWDGSLKLWQVGPTGSGRCLQTLVGHTEKVQCLTWSPDGATLASGSFDHTIRLWDAKLGSARVALQGHRAVVDSLAFTPDSGQLLSGSEDGTLRLWDVQRGELLRVLQGYTAALYDLDWSPDGTALASAGADSVVTIWQVEGRAQGRPPGLLRGHEWSVYGVGWRPGGGVLASSGWDGVIRLWDGTTGSCLQVIGDLDNPDTVFCGVTWSPDGKLLASATYGRGVLVWEGRARSLRWIGRELPVVMRRLAWSPDGTRLVAGAEDGHVYVWAAKGGRLLERLPGHHGAVLSVAWSPDGSRLASGGGSHRGELFVWDAHSGERLSTLEGLAEVIYTVAWHPAGDRLISGDSSGRLRWWQLQSGQCVRVQEAHQGTVYALKVSPDGTRLASCGDDGAIQIWDVQSGQHLRTLRRDRPYERVNITGIRGLTEAEIATLRALGAVEEEAVHST